MSELLKQMKHDKKLACKREIEYRKANTTSGTMYDASIAVKEVVRAVISMFPEINSRPDKATDDQTIQLVKKYISSEKIRELYLQHILSGTMVIGLTAKDLNNLQKEKIAEMGDSLTSIKIGIAQTYLPKQASVEEVTEWIDKNIDFTELRNKMQAIGLVKKQFKGVDGLMVKKIIEDI